VVRHTDGLYGSHFHAVGSLFANAQCWFRDCLKMSVFSATPLLLLVLALKSVQCSPQGVRGSELDDSYEAEIFTPMQNPHEENKYDFENGHNSENFDEFSELGELPDYSGMGKFVTTFLKSSSFSSLCIFYYHRSQIKMAKR
jgi:hypothetical protein